MLDTSILPRRAAWGLTLALGLLAATAQADRNDPGSLLIYPEYDSRPGSFTFLTVTNTHPTESVRVHFNWVNEETCLKNNASKTLTPRDTVTFYSSTSNPNQHRGFCFAYARSSANGQPIDFDYLIGSSISMIGSTASEYSMNALVFAGQTGHGNSTEVTPNGDRDLDGVEYSKTPDEIAIPRFFGQTEVQGMPRADLILIGLTGTRFETSIDFLIYNDNEEVFSSEYSFDCWDRVPLLDISGAFRNDFLLNGTNHDPGEILGFNLFESGWFIMDGGIATSTTTSIPDPAFLAVMVELGRMSSADLPFTIGEQENGGLLSTSLSGN